MLIQSVRQRYYSANIDSKNIYSANTTHKNGQSSDLLQTWKSFDSFMFIYEKGQGSYSRLIHYKMLQYILYYPAAKRRQQMLSQPYLRGIIFSTNILNAFLNYDNITKMYTTFPPHLRQNCLALNYSPLKVVEHQDLQFHSACYLSDSSSFA